MKIVFYSTNSNYFDKTNIIYTTTPDFETLFNQFKNLHKEHTFQTATQPPGMFLPPTSPTIDSNNTAQIAQYIISLNPDIAIATSFWTAPYDWLPVKDALVAQELRKNGIKTICNSVQTTMLCFDKWETHNFLEKNNFNHARGVLVKHDLYFCAGNQKDVIENVYKESILAQIKELNFPVVIKDNVGLSSYGMAVANTFGEVTNYLNSKKNNSDRIVEEYIDGQQFGTEIYGCKGNYSVLPPFKFSVNQYGITSPKLSTKYGPFYENYELLESELQKMARELELEGCAQVDLVLKDGKWYVIEINPRLSGMTLTYSAAMNMSVYEMLYLSCIENKKLPLKLTPTINKKHELCTVQEITTISGEPNVKFIFQIENRAHKQEREKGYCEIILSDDSLQNDFLS